MKKFVIIFLLLAALPFSASARYHGGSYVSVGFGGGGYYPGYYPAPVYYPQPVYVQPAPVIVQEGPYGTYARPSAPPPAYYDDRPVNRYDNNYCREFTRNVKINGRIQQSYGTACQQPDGSWQLVN